MRPPEANHFVLEVVSSKSFKQCNAAREITYRARLRDPVADVPLNFLLPHLHALFDTVLQEARRDYGESGVMRIYISHPKLEKAILVPPTYLGYLTSELVLEHIDNVLYSAGEIPADEDLEINAGIVEFIEGKGRKPITNLEKDIKSKRAFVHIKNTDNSCLPRAIMVGYWHSLAMSDPTYKKFYGRVRDCRGQFQTSEANKLRNAVGVPPDRAGNIEDIPLYETFLQTSIVVLSSRIGNKKVYAGSPLYNRKIFIYHSDNGEGGHFDTITKVNALMCTSYYCEKCDKGFKSKGSHKCSDWCNICGRSKCRELMPILCPDCNKRCRSNECFMAHKRKQTSGRGRHKNKTLASMCEQSWQCPDCGVNINTESRKPTLHECGEVKCKVCGEYHLDDGQHLCYMRAFSSDVEPDKFIFYDFECTQEDGKHVPNFVVAQSVCNECEKSLLQKKKDASIVVQDVTCVTNMTTKKKSGKEIHVKVVVIGKSFLVVLIQVKNSANG